MTWTEVAKLEDFQDCDRIAVQFQNLSVLIVRAEDQLHAFENRCPHADLPLDEGEIDQGLITCPYHGAQFCIKSGQVKCPPAFEDLQVFEIKVDANHLYLKSET